MLCLTIQRDSGRWWASTDSEVCLTTQRDSGRWWSSTDSEVCLITQRDSERWWASSDSEGRLTIVNFCFDSTMLCSAAGIA